ncbi:unnamed protein product [Malus baccata var. baccata]
MRSDSQWRWKDPTFDYYDPGLKKHPSFRWVGTQQPFEQPNVPQDSEEWCVIQSPQCATSYDYLCPMEEKAHADPKIPTEPFTTQVYMPHIPHQEAAMQPTKLNKVQEKKKTFYGSQIPHRQIRPMHKLWVLNTRWKSVRQRRKPRLKGLSLITRIHSDRRADIKDSTTFKHSVNKHQVNHYLILFDDAVKDWLTLHEQVT